ncbi:MAG: N-acetylmuramic acid 6-phosphate etherase [Nitrospiraceae bacterium]|nr:N-acetylmuramic acid 6-phosphate etherase [Nitrospiraceae bacterium]
MRKNAGIRQTERTHPLSKGSDALPVRDFLRLMHAGSRAAFDAVGSALPGMEKVVRAATSAIRAGGRVYYAGAGTSGRLGAIDAAEVGPTFGSDAFKAVIAGGPPAMLKAAEGAEDDRDEGRRLAGQVKKRDLAIGISASGKTPFVAAFLEEASRRGAPAWLICSNRVRYGFLAGTVLLPTGPELIAGSTRLNAATAQKLCLNLISTAVMVQLGGAYDGHMVGVVPANRKLVERAKRIIAACTGCSLEEAGGYLDSSGMNVKVAILMRAKGVTRRRAQKLLKENGGRLRGLID